MARFRTHHAGADGWSEWTQPVMHGYKVACCDCGLVHDVEFTVLRVTHQHADGAWEGEPLDPDHYRVGFRARRNKRSTAQMRRHNRRRAATSTNEQPGAIDGTKATTRGP